MDYDELADAVQQEYIAEENYKRGWNEAIDEAMNKIEGIYLDNPCSFKTEIRDEIYTKLKDLMRG